MNRYEALENSLVALFNQPLTTQQVFDVAALPETETLYNNAMPRPYVYFSYDSSDFTDSETLSRVTQEEKILIGCEIHSKTRRGTKGVLEIFDIVKQKVLGKKFTGFDKFSLIKTNCLPGAGSNNWVFYAQFTTSGHITDVQTDPDSSEYYLTDPEFIVETAV